MSVFQKKALKNVVWPQKGESQHFAFKATQTGPSGPPTNLGMMFLFDWRLLLEGVLYLFPPSRKSTSRWPARTDTQTAGR